MFSKFRMLQEDDLEESSSFWPLIQSVSSRDAFIHHLYAKATHNHSRKAKIELMKQLNHMMMADEVFSSFLDRPAHSLHQCRHFAADGTTCLDEWVPRDFDCLRTLIKSYEDNCGKFNDYSRRYIKYLVRECEQPVWTIDQLKSKISAACDH